jgi:hypothetical protein
MKNIIFSKTGLIIIIILLVTLLTTLFIYFSNLNIMTIKGSNSKNIKINNIEKIKNTENINNTDIILEQTPEFIISYYRPDQSFAISIMSENFITNRERAEKELLKILGINSKEACNLKLTLGTPAFVSDKYAGINYGLSFCPDGRPF